MKYIDKIIDIETASIGGNEKYFCVVRKSYVPATPEEKVRQNFLKYLIEKQNFPINRIFVEKSLAHYGRGNRRVDILVEDSEGFPFFIYECKKSNEYLTDDVWDQALDYFEKLDTVEYVGVVIGNFLELRKLVDNPIRLKNIKQPSIKDINTNNYQIITEEEIDYKRFAWRKPIRKEIIDELIREGIIGEGTDEKYHSFIVNLDGWLLDQGDKLSTESNIEDLGIKFTKFGSAGGGNFAKEFRRFLVRDHVDKPIVCISFTSMVSGKNSPVRTAIYVGVETVKSRNASLQIQVGKSIHISDDKVSIDHDGTITIGRYGAAKKQDLLDFVTNRKPSLIKNGIVHLGEFYEIEEINSQNVGPFIKKLIDYALIRNEFREIRKHTMSSKR